MILQREGINLFLCGRSNYAATTKHAKKKILSNNNLILLVGKMHH